MKKPRSDARLKRMAKKKRDALYKYLVGDDDDEGHSLEEGVSYCRREFAMKVSVRALSEFRAWHADHLRIEYALGRASNALDAIKGEGSEEIAAKSHALREMAVMMFMAEAMESKDVEVFTAVGKLAASFQKLSNDAKRIALLERKALELDRAKQALRNDGLTKQQQDDEVRRILGADQRVDRTPKPSTKSATKKKATKKKATKKAAKKRR